MRTLRGRLLLYTSAATAVVLLAAGLAVYFLTRASLFAEFDGALLAAARALHAASEQHASGVRVEVERAQFPEFSRERSPDYFQVWLDDGTPVARSESLDVLKADLSRPATGAGAAEPAFDNVRLPDGRIGRAVRVSYVPRNEDEGRPGHPAFVPRGATVAVARHTGPLEGRLRDLRWLLVAVGLTATAVTAGTLHWAVKRGLRPLDALGARIAGVGQDNLLEPIELPDTPAELRGVVDRLNALLGRLHEAISRERGFTADVAHELRTPLAGMEVTLEVAALKPRTTADYQARIDKSLSIVRDMRSMVENLLTLARAESGRLPVTRSEVVLDSFVENCWSHFAARAAARGLSAVLEVGPSVSVHTDPDKLRIVLHNLMDNAVSYCDPGGTISVAGAPGAEGGAEGGAVALRITNPAAAITPAQAARASDRFWRADPARADTGAHCGLGLALCQKIVALLGATLRVRVTDDHQFEATLELLGGAQDADAARDGTLARSPELAR